MMQLFKKIPFHVKLLIIGLLPLIFLMIVSVQLHRQRNEKIAVAEATMLRLQRSAAVGQLIDALQSERRYSFNYAVTQQEKGNLPLLRDKTDEALQKLLTLDTFGSAALKNYTFLNKLDVMRQQLDEHKLQPMQVMNFYTNIISRIGAAGYISVTNIPFMMPLNQDVIGQRVLSEMITYLGNLRANIYYNLYTKRGLADAPEQLASLNDIYKSYITEFYARASASAIRDFNIAMSSEDVKATNTYINSIFSKGYVDTIYSADEWWLISAKAVDRLKTLQRSLLQDVLDDVNVIYKAEIEARNRNLFFLVIAVVLVLFISSIVTKAITDSLNEIKNAAKKISVGASDITLDVPANDVIGMLASSIAEVDRSNNELAAAADAIGKGKFDTIVTPRSEEDVLGNAIAAMKTDLERFNAENQRKIWLQTGWSKVNDAIRGEKDVMSISRDVTEVIVSYLNAQIGLVYITYSHEGLFFTHGHAIADKNSVPTTIPFGETLIGQAALNKKILALSDVPHDYTNIKTASGNTASKHLLIVPLLHNEEVEGVIEIGALQEFHTDAITFLEQAATNIAIAIQAAKSKTRLQELLEETQAQSEELQAQHTELENLNTELEAQAQKLQASEEELKVQQEELLQSNQELEERSRLLEERNQLIAERNLEIQKKAEQLELSTKYKSEFLANMSHELRTPLNSILLLSRLLAENHEKNLSPDQVEYANVIQSSGTGLLSLIDEILDLSKIEAGKMALEYDMVHINAVAEEMRRLFTPIANQKQIGFHVHINDNVPTVETDKQRLEQILKNLLSNALKFTSKGSVTLDIRKDERTQQVEFSVKDTGIGIPKEKQGLIFEAFQQADGSTRRKFGGTGLGLSISRQLAKLLGGTLRLTSEPDKGSEFILSIPQTRSNLSLNDNAQDSEQQILDIAPASTEIKTEEEDSGFIATAIPEDVPDDRAIITNGDKSLLIVEDDTAFAKALLDFTRSKGYKGIVTVRGDEAVQLTRQYMPVGILLDVQLPVKSGWDVMEELKKDPHTRHIPVHIMSSHTVKKESLKKGAIDFINKPVSIEKMQDIFNKIEYVRSKENKKVLIIEENTRHAKALAYFLGSYNVNAEISGSINSGVSALQKSDVDCVILDMGIPDTSAYNALEKIKENPGLENLPIIVFTGKSLSKPEEEKLRQYADAIVVKTAHSYKRILDEVSLFLHLMEEQKNGSAKNGSGRLGRLNEVLRNKTILVTDDDVRNIFSLTKALETHQMNVLSATDGKDALRVLKEHPDIDVVLMDIMMPEMDGYETMKHIRMQPQYRHLPIIAVTAKAMVGDREKCIQAGASDYISKPVDVDQLLSLLRVWLYDKA